MVVVLLVLPYSWHSESVSMIRLAFDRIPKSLHSWVGGVLRGIHIEIGHGRQRFWPQAINHNFRQMKPLEKRRYHFGYTCFCSKQGFDLLRLVCRAGSCRRPRMEAGWTVCCARAGAFSSDERRPNVTKPVSRLIDRPAHEAVLIWDS